MRKSITNSEHIKITYICKFCFASNSLYENFYNKVKEFCRNYNKSVVAFF